MKEKNNKKKKGNKNNLTSQTTKKETAKKEVKEKKVVENKDKEVTSLITGSEIKNLLIIVLVVTAIFLIFYGITTIVTKNKDNNDTSIGETIIQYDEILIGTLFEQPNAEYYVLVTKEEDAYVSTYTNLLSMYGSKENAIRFYTSNLDSGFNKLYISEQSNISNNLKELKLNVSTLLKIRNKSIVATYEGNTQIVDHLNSLLK